MTVYTSDTLFNGALQIEQERSGYRYSVDAIILAGHVYPRPGDRVLELGAGCGVVLLILAYRHPRAQYQGVEVQPDLYELCLRNVQANRMQDHIRLHRMDLKQLEPSQLGGPVDLVICNPPYRKAASGRLNPNHQKAIARHEMKMTLPELLNTASRLLQAGGKFTIVYTVERLSELLLEMSKAGIEPKYLRVVHSTLVSDAKLVLVEGIRDGRSGCRIAPPLVMMDESGAYTPEMASLFEG